MTQVTTTPRDELLARIVAEVAAHGLRDRSLRDVAEAVGSSHRMVLYHFGSRAGLVAAVVAAVEAAQRDTLRDLAAECSTAGELIRALWARVSSEELRPFVRLFFESLTTDESLAADLTAPWLDDGEAASALVGADYDPVEVRLGVAVTRGLLVDVLATGDTRAPTESLERFIAMWEAARADV